MSQWAEKLSSVSVFRGRNEQKRMKKWEGNFSNALAGVPALAKVGIVGGGGAAAVAGGTVHWKRLQSEKELQKAREELGSERARVAALEAAVERLKAEAAGEVVPWRDQSDIWPML